MPTKRPSAEARRAVPGLLDRIMPRPAPNLPPQIAEGGIVAPRRQPRRSAVELLVSAANERAEPVEIQRARKRHSSPFRAQMPKTEPVYKTGQGEIRWVVRALVVRGARKRVALSVDVPQARHRLTKQRLRTLVITGVLRATTPQDAPGHSATESRSRFPARHIACQHWPTLPTAQEKASWNARRGACPRMRRHVPSPCCV